MQSPIFFHQCNLQWDSPMFSTAVSHYTVGSLCPLTPQYEKFIHEYEKLDDENDGVSSIVSYL